MKIKSVLHNLFHQGFSYLKYLLTARNEHSLHSPFVFELYTKVIQSKQQSADFEPIELLREQLLHNAAEIEVLDFGAGSKINNTPQRRIKDIARNAEKPRKFAELLYRLVRNFQPQTIFDLGTSLGLTTLYLAKAKPDARLLTFEGCPETARIAQNNLDQVLGTNSQNQLIIGNIDETLEMQVVDIKQIDFIFFDANHRYEPTIRYFETCLLKAHESSVFVFDDIHWSQEMEQAWHYIKAHATVTITIDLFFVGLVFFRKKQPKQHFVLRF